MWCPVAHSKSGQGCVLSPVSSLVMPRAHCMNRHVAGCCLGNNFCRDESGMTLRYLYLVGLSPTTHIIFHLPVHQVQASVWHSDLFCLLVATLLELTVNGFLDIPHNEVLCFFLVQSTVRHNSSMESFASSNVFQSCHY